MKKKNGFTLIELLAIIVILAIIAVITVPIILNIIESSKRGAAKDSAYGYKDSVNKWYVSKLTEDPNYVLNDGTYSVSELETTVEGKQPGSNSWVTIANSDITDGCLQFDEYKVEITNGNVGEASIGKCESPIMAKYASLIVTEGDGLYKSTTDSGRLIYRGANPNNYINIKEDGTNNTLYRIVSYETDGTIKVVRDEKSFKKEWDEANVRKSDGTSNTYCGSASGCNVWGSQSNTLYNGSALGDNFHYIFYSSPTATTLTHGGSGKVDTESTLNKYLNDGSWAGLSNLESYIDTHSWNVGVVYYTSAGDKGLIKEKEEERQLTWNGKVGLMNITEYVEASLNPTCTSVYSNYGYDCGSPCKEMNWTYKNYMQWSLTPTPYSKTNVWFVDKSGSFGMTGANATNAGVRPAFYLKSNIELDGEGTDTNPYRIVGM